VNSRGLLPEPDRSPPILQTSLQGEVRDNHFSYALPAFVSKSSQQAKLRKEEILARLILLDEFHIESRIPHGTRDTQCIATKRILDTVDFRSQIRRAVVEVLRRYPALKLVRIRISR
jgi:hypothetical protein